MLSSMFPTVLSASLDILDNGKVTRFVTQQTRREFFRVKDSRKSVEKATPVAYFDVVDNFCFCFFFAKQCMDSKGSSLICKHVLAAKLASAMSKSHPDKLNVKEIEELDYAPLLLSSKNHL